MASFGVNPASPGASKSSSLRKTCPSWIGSESTSHNHCDVVLGPIGACPFWAGLFLFQRKLQKPLSGAALLHSWSVEKSTGLQDHTTLPYASATLVSRSSRVHRSPPQRQ